jgi:hypothetical protein
MGGSNWNSLLDRLLAENLTVAEHRLALALARLLLGWNRNEAQLGQRLLRETAGLDGRTFDRALAALIEKELVGVTTPGPRQRSTYKLLPAPQRAELPAPQRAEASTHLPALRAQNCPLYSGDA